MPSAAHSGMNAAAYAVRPPVVSFTVSVSGRTVSVDCSASYGTSSPIVTSNWNFGDGATATGVMQSHTYTAAATYTITYTAVQADGASASASRDVAVSGATQPTGSDIAPYQSLSGSTFDARWDNAGTNYLSLASGTFSFSDFAADSAQYGADSGASKGILGTGVAYTTIQMNAGTSTKASTANSGSVNPYYLLEQNHITNSKFDGFTLNGTNQGHDYNALRSDYAAGVTFSNVKITDIPGSSPSPPGETFHINVYAGTNPVFDTVEFDGNWVSASAGATNGSTKDSTSAVNGTLTYTHVFGHDIKYGKIYAGWQTFGGGIFNECMCVNTAFGYGFEECGGTFTFNDCIFGGNTADIHLGNSHANRTKLIINDPVLLAGQTKIKAYIPPTYGGNGGGNGNAQSASDITIRVNGVDKTSTMLQVITGWIWNSDGSYKGTPITYTRPSWIPWN